MTDGAVPSGEMRWPAAQTDPIDAVLDDVAVDDDLLDVAAVVHDVRAAYLSATPLRRSAALAAFTDAPLDAVDDPVGDPAGGAPAVRRDDAAVAAVGVPRHTGRRRRTRTTMLSTLCGFLGTLTGKALLGTAIAAASVGGLHAADVVDVPGLPADDRPAADTRADGAGADAGAESGTPADAGTAGQVTAAEKHAAAEAHAEAVRQWTGCIADAAAARGDDQTRTDGPFDPREACGEMPTPGDFGLTDLPAQAADAARATKDATAGPGRPGATAPAGNGAVPESSGDAPATPSTSGTAPTQPGAVPDGADAAAGGPANASPDAGAGERP